MLLLHFCLPQTPIHCIVCSHRFIILFRFCFKKVRCSRLLFAVFAFARLTVVFFAPKTEKTKKLIVIPNIHASYAVTSSDTKYIDQSRAGGISAITTVYLALQPNYSVEPIQKLDCFNCIQLKQSNFWIGSTL